MEFAIAQNSIKVKVNLIYFYTAQQLMSCELMRYASMCNTCVSLQNERFVRRTAAIKSMLKHHERS